MIRRLVLECAPFAPGWLRRCVPWWGLVWLTGRWHLCWVQVVTWRLSSDEVSLEMGASCWSGSVGQEYDYCGRYQTREAFDAALGGVAPPGDGA